MTIGIADAIKPELDDKGTTAIVEWLTRTPDRAAGTATETTTTQTPNPKCAIENFDRGKIDGANVRFGDLMATLLAQDLDNVPVPDTTRVQLFGVWYVVVALEPFPDGDTVAAYRLHLRVG